VLDAVPTGLGSPNWKEYTVDDDEDDREYMVVINDEEQYSIWFADRDLPPGWRAVEVSGSKRVCLEYVGRVWTDMRPRSLREAMTAHLDTQEAVRS
jgi:MbtH protein